MNVALVMLIASMPGHLCMLGAVLYVLQHADVGVVGGEMPSVKIGLPRDSPDIRIIG